MSQILPEGTLSNPVLWHTDLHGGNILIDDAAKITGIIDWQGTTIGPIFVQSMFAKCILPCTDSRIVIPGGYDLPTLPSDLDQYSEVEKVKIKKHLRRALLHKTYQFMITRFSPDQLAVHEYPPLEFLMPTVYSFSRTWYEGAHRLRQYLLDAEESWDSLALATAFPIQWDSEVLRQHRLVQDSFKIHTQRVEELYKELHVEGDGWVSNERYEEVKAKSDKLKLQWDDVANGGPYPLVDGATSWFLNG